MVTRALPAAAVLLLGACAQFTTVDGAPVRQLPRPVVLMHRGAGQFNPDYRENTLPALLYGAGIYDGTEMDLQLSEDGTLWLGHDNEVHDCTGPTDGPTDGAVVGCFQNLHDAQVDAVSWCDVSAASPCGPALSPPTTASPSCRQHYVRLADVFETFSTDPTLVHKLLALDVKDQLCATIPTGIPESRTMADALDALVRTYGMDFRLLVESDQTTFMSRFRSNGTRTYLFVEGYGGVDPIIADAAQQGANGISYRYTNAPFDPSLPAGLRDRGLRVIVWPVPMFGGSPLIARVEDIPPVWEMAPDVILTDMPDFYDYLPSPQLLRDGPRAYDLGPVPGAPRR